MNTTNPKKNHSGTTSPLHPQTVSTGLRMRSDSSATVMTTVTQFSSPSIHYPAPPVNSPAASVADAASVMGHAPDAASIASKLASMPADLTTPPSSEIAEVKSDGDNTLGRTSTAGSKHDEGAKPKPKMRSPSQSPEFPEHSTWAALAEEDVSNALKRLTTLAKDEHKWCPVKSAEEVYSARLTKLIKEGELKYKFSDLD